MFKRFAILLCALLCVFDCWCSNSTPSPSHLIRIVSVLGSPALSAYNDHKDTIKTGAFWGGTVGVVTCGAFGALYGKNPLTAIFSMPGVVITGTTTTTGIVTCFMYKKIISDLEVLKNGQKELKDGQKKLIIDVEKNGKGIERVEQKVENGFGDMKESFEKLCEENEGIAKLQKETLMKLRNIEVGGESTIATIEKIKDELKNLNLFIQFQPEDMQESFQTAQHFLEEKLKDLEQSMQEQNQKEYKALEALLEKGEENRRESEHNVQERLTTLDNKVVLVAQNVNNGLEQQGNNIDKVNKAISRLEQNQQSAEGNRKQDSTVFMQKLEQQGQKLQQVQGSVANLEEKVEQEAKFQYWERQKSEWGSEEIIDELEKILNQDGKDLIKKMKESREFIPAFRALEKIIDHRISFKQDFVPNVEELRQFFQSCFDEKISIASKVHNIDENVKTLLSSMNTFLTRSGQANSTDIGVNGHPVSYSNSSSSSSSSLNSIEPIAPMSPPCTPITLSLSPKNSPNKSLQEKGFIGNPIKLPPSNVQSIGGLYGCLMHRQVATVTYNGENKR